MAFIEISRAVNLDAPVVPEGLTGGLYATEYDAHKFIITAYRGKTEIALDGQVTGSFIRADSGTETLTGSVVDGKAQLTLPASCYAVPGRFALTIYNTSVSGSKATIYAAVGSVYQTTTGTIIDPGSVVPDITDITAAYNSMLDATAAATAAAESVPGIIAPTFSVSLPYNTGDIVYYNGSLYRFITAHVAGAWSASETVAVVTDNEVAALAKTQKAANAFDFLNGEINYESRTINSVTFSWTDRVCTVSGQYTSGNTPTSRLYNNSSKLPRGMKVGETYYVSFASSSANVMLAIYPYISGTLDRTAVILRTANSTYPNIRSFILPANTTGLLVRLEAVTPNTAISATTSDVMILGEYTQGWLRSYIGDKYDTATAYAQGARNILAEFANYESRTAGNIKWTWSGGVCTVESTDGEAASTQSTSRLYTDTTHMPTGLTAGGLYYVHYTTTSGTVWLDVYCYKQDTTSTKYIYKGDGLLKIPSDTVGILIRLEVAVGTELPGDVTVSAVGIETAPPNAALMDCRLYPTGDSSDRTEEIERMLEIAGKCELVSGRYYVFGVDMPDGTMLEGYGDKSEVILSGTDATAGYAIRLNSRCTIQNLAIKGNLENHDNDTDVYSSSATYYNRHGIIWDGVFTADKTMFSSTSSTPARGMLRNLYITNFSGGAISLNNTGTNVHRGITVSDCTIWYCYAGINIRYYSEFNKFSNVASTHCNFGCINNGGNNLFTNCNFSKNVIGFIINNYEGRSPNNGHGSVTGCIFDHSDGNTGTGIRLINVTPGEVFDGCQLFYSGIYITDSTGIIFTGLNAGWGPNISGEHYGERITIEGNGLVMFNGCGFRVQPNKTISGSNVKFNDCYTWTGETVDATSTT
ncbi:MAG: hypothetical protein IJJ23_03645 [Clostridia bacterium]|nr:hypothetical protein [Clostridia bacterium]